MAELKKKNFDIPAKKPPQAIEAESSVLGALMLDKSAMNRVADLLNSNDFYKKAHQDIYQAMLDLFIKGEAIDVLTIANRLSEKDILKDIGGNSYLTSLVNSVPTASHVLEYAKIVKRKRILRNLIDASYDIGELGYNETEDTDVLLDRAEKRIFSIAQQALTQDFLPVKSTLENAFERIDALSKQKGGLRGLPSGFQTMDNILAGFQKSDLILLASRPAMGKSSLALNFAANVAINTQLPVGLFSLEMSIDQIVDRLIASQSGIDLWRLRTGRISGEGEENDFTRIRRALGVLSEAPIFIDDAASVNVLQIRAMARRLQAREGLGMIIIDYLQLMQPKNSLDNEVRQMTEVSRSLKILARELNVPVLAISQLSRAVEKRIPPRPILSDLRQSGSLEQDADVVMFIYRERDRETNRYKNESQVIIAKHRNGPVGMVPLYFDDRTVSFRSIETRFDEEPTGEF